MELTVEKVEGFKPYRWCVLRDGKLATDRLSIAQRFKTRKSALEAVPKLRGWIEYEARILAEDKSGIVWTPGEQESIQELTDALLENRTVLTLFGGIKAVESAHRQHNSDAQTIESWGYHGGTDNLVCAEVRRRRAGRVEAFRRAGMDLDRKRFTLWVSRESKERKPLTHYRYGSLREAEESRDDIIQRGAEHGETDYQFEITEAIV